MEVWGLQNQEIQQSTVILTSRKSLQCMCFFLMLQYPAVEHLPVPFGTPFGTSNFRGHFIDPRCCHTERTCPRNVSYSWETSRIQSYKSDTNRLCYKMCCKTRLFSHFFRAGHGEVRPRGSASWAAHLGQELAEPRPPPG